MNETQSARNRRVLLLALAAVMVAAIAWTATSIWASARKEPAGSPVQAHAAATFVQLDLPAATAGADVIVMGNVVRDLPCTRGLRVDPATREQLRARGLTDTQIDAQAQEFADWVYTASLFDVEEVLKGDCATGTIEVRNVGGEVAGYVFEAQDFPRLVVGEREVVFLGRAWDGGYEPLAVYSINGEMASTTDQGRDDRIRLAELLAIVRSHQEDTSPMAPTE